jgi:hypothetical protein
MVLDSEPRAEPAGLVVYISTMKWQKPHDQEPVGSDEMERIKRNITDSLSSFSIQWSDR